MHKICLNLVRQTATQKPNSKNVNRDLPIIYAFALSTFRFSLSRLSLCRKFKHNTATVLAILILMIPGSAIAAQSGDSLYGKHLREIRITGARYTDTDIITRELASQVGQPYLEENAKKDYNRLDKLDLFSEIRITPRKQDGGVVLDIHVREIFPYLPFLSYEVTDENGFAAGPGLQSVNMFRRDIFLTGSARFGGATNINIFLVNPWITGNHFGYVLEFFRRERFNELDQFNETATELYLTLDSYLGENGRIGGRFIFQAIESDSLGRTLSADNTDIVPTLGFFLGYDSRDLWSNPHTGWWNEIEISRSGGFLGGDSDFWRLNLDLRRYVPVMRRHTLALFSLTTLTTGTVGQDIAPWQDFSIGGTNSVRGWELDTRRGKNQFLNTAEYRVTVVRPRVFTLPFGLSFDIGLQLAAFGDLGVAWNESDQFKTDNFIGGYGAGVRFLVPFVNMFRFDFADGQSGKSFQVHIGSFAKPVAQRFRVR